MKTFFVRPGGAARCWSGFLGLMLTMLSTDGQAAVISIPNPAANVWRANLASINSDTYTYTDVAGLFSPAGFVVQTFLDDNTSNLIAPVGSLMFRSGTNMMVGGIYVRAGAVFDASNFYRDGATDTFLSIGSFYDGATPGANNYLGIKITDTSGQQHYGWLQYTLAAYNNGTTAVVFDSGYLNDVPGVGVVAGAVPEPSTVAIVFGGSFILAGGCWRRRRNRA